jgi:hypothetical protein
VQRLGELVARVPRAASVVQRLAKLLARVPHAASVLHRLCELLVLDVLRGECLLVLWVSAKSVLLADEALPCHVTTDRDPEGTSIQSAIGCVCHLDNALHFCG